MAASRLVAARDAQLAPLFAPYDRADAPGMSVAVLERGRVAWARAYGLADVEAGVPATTQTNYRLAAVSKPFTAMAVLLLVHEGRLRLDDRLLDLIPEFPAYGAEIRIRHLLAHTSGLLDYEGLMPPGARKQVHDADVLALLAGREATYFPPGTRFRYSNSGYAVLAVVVERVAGVPYGRFLRERIFLPLRMKGTVANERRQEIAHRAWGYTPRPPAEGGGFARSDQSPTSAVLGDGGIYSSIADLVRWDAALSGDSFLPQALIREAFTPAVLPDGTATHYGYGWIVDSFQGILRVRHDGWTGGFRSALERYPDRARTIIVLANRADVHPGIIAEEIARRVLPRR